MSAEPNTKPQQEQISEEQQTLIQQQENDASDDEEFLSDSAEIVDSNDISNSLQQDLNLNLGKSNQKVWLVRLPRFLADKWRNKENLHGQQLGFIKIKKSVPVGQSNSISLQLNDDESNRDIPHKYNRSLTKQVVENQYVFNEQNLSDFTQEEAQKTEMDFSKKNNLVTGDSIASSINPTPTSNGTSEPFSRRRRKFNKFKNKDGSEKLLPFVKTIPKKTSIIGTIVHECQATPDIHDPNYTKIIELRKKMMKEDTRPTVTLLNKRTGVNTLTNAGVTLKADQSTFLRTSATTKNKAEGRAIRMPQKDLFDLLFKLFDEYDYWSLKGLKDRTKQPDVYLKETLDQIAVLIKKGPYALKYALKKEYKELKDQERAARLGDLAKEEREEDSEEEKEEDVEMEDIV